jgi:excisionase family DNA binding protein
MAANLPKPNLLKLLSPAELAEYLDVPLRTVYVWRSVGTGPQGIRVGKHVRYRPADVDRWLDQQADQRVQRGPSR